MPEVSGSSSSNDNTVTTGSRFDVSSQAGIASVLKQLRVSALPKETKDTVRELVLKYTQSGGDTTLRTQLESTLATISLSTAESPQSPQGVQEAGSVDNTEPATTDSGSMAQPEVRQRNGFSGARPLPQFSKPQPKRVEKTIPVVRTETPTAPVVDKPKTQPVPPKTQPEPVSKTIPIVQAEPNVKPISSVPVSQDEIPEVSTQGNIKRITEIKRAVISLVGNPVNLVDIDNDVGKLYMSALLEAMKKTNSGTKPEAEAAMAKLETAFKAVETLMAAQEQPDFEPVEESTAPVTNQEVAKPSEPSTKSNSAPASPVVNRAQAPVPVSNSEPISSQALPKNIKENLVQDEKTWTETAAEQVTTPDSPITTEASVTETPQLGGAPLQDIPTYGFSKPPRQVGVPPRITPQTVAEPVEKPQPDTPPVVSTSTETSTPVKATSIKPPVPPAPAQKIASIENELMTPDITVGLTQLLSEWKIFKGSGLFGMGPGGIDHPLYISIKDSSMLSVMNGTFTGATAEIQQSINDYINGWRYEQSIVPQHSETFEYFLRRVVRKVLKDAKR